MLTFDNWKITKFELSFEINVRGIHFINAETGFIVGYNGEIYKTNNAGKSWQKQNSETKSHLQKVSRSEKVCEPTKSSKIEKISEIILNSYFFHVTLTFQNS